MMLRCRSLARAKISLIIHIYAVRNRVKIMRQTEILHYGEQFIFAMKTARGIVAGVLRTIEFGSGDDLKWNSLFAGESDGVCQMAAREAGRVGDRRQHICTQNLIGSQSQECGIRSAGGS